MVLLPPPLSVKQADVPSDDALIVRLCPTMLTPDKWESARFASFFLASSFSRFPALSIPAHQRVTLAVTSSDKTKTKPTHLAIQT
jgi:hypothetical protein